MNDTLAPPAAPSRSTAMRVTALSLVIVAALLSACAAPAPYPTPVPPPPAPTPPQVETQPVAPPPEVGEAQPLPPTSREPELGAASRALVTQAQAQLATGNHAIASSSIERALRIEPDNPLLWIELGKVRQAEGNYVQAENMARRALALSVNAPRTQAAALQLLAESYRARGMNLEAREAETRAQGLR